MKTCRLVLPLLVWPLVVSIGGCAEKKDPPPAAPDAPVVPAPKPVVEIPVVAPAVPSTGTVPLAPVTWDAIQAIPYDRKAEFVAGVMQLGQDLDVRIGELEARAAARKTDAPDWDLAMRTLRDARSYLTSVTKELPASTAEFWYANRDKAGRALKDVQDAIDKVKRTATS